MPKRKVPITTKRSRSGVPAARRARKSAQVRKPPETQTARTRKAAAAHTTHKVSVAPSIRDSFDWAAFEEALAKGRSPESVVRGVRGGATVTKESFAEGELEDLTRLAERAQLVRSRSPVLGNVVFLHGITGSNLAVVNAKGDSDGIWVNAPRLVLGRIEDLKLDPTGTREADPNLTVQTTGLNKKYYAKAVLALRARWNVEPYAYDWRKDVDVASDGLAALIRDRLPKQPVHLVVHSLGGLVARNFIRRHAKLWDTMQGTDLVAGGRLIMLGTPNYGSFAIPPVLTGTDQMIELLAKLDLRHNMARLLEITNTFLGCYMLLPAPSKLSGALQALYQRATWGGTPSISQAYLNRTFQFFQDLDASATIDPRRMIYIAGCRRATFSGMTIVAPGEFEYKLSLDGDGRVPHELGLLKDVPTYYVDEVHGDLARNDQVLRAVDDLLATGKTDELVTSPLRAPTRAAPTMRDYRSAADLRLMEELARVADKARQAQGPQTLTPEEEQIAADALVKAALGTSSRSLPQSLAAAPRVPVRHATGGAPVALDVGVRFGDVTQIRAPAVVVGHYHGIPPVNAIGAIDAALKHWVARAVKQQMISGTLGETFFVPTFGRIAADSVVIGGMGEFGRFGPADLRLLMTNVAIGAGAMGYPSLATVVVGAGSLDRDVALLELLEGVGTGLRQLREEKVFKVVPLKRLDLIENNPKRFADLVEKVASIAASGSLSSLKIRAVKPDAAEMRRASAAERARGPASMPRSASREAPPVFDEVRITIERPDFVSATHPAARPAPIGQQTPVANSDPIQGVPPAEMAALSRPRSATFRFSALTKTAVVPVREVTIQEQFAEDAAAALRTSRTRDEQEKFGQLLYTYLMPEEFQDIVDTSAPVKLIVDRSTASFPWEMACFPGRNTQGEGRWLGTDLKLSRQFRTALARAPGISPPLNDRLRVLVIADPAPERELQLKGARAEGRPWSSCCRARTDSASATPCSESRCTIASAPPSAIRWRSWRCC
jgi:pimeloyl-ACP methyl ester carboxylesterase